jgi:subtilisin family serine protease
MKNLKKLILLCGLGALITAFIGCKKEFNPSEQLKSPVRADNLIDSNDNSVDTVLVVWKNPDSTITAYNNWLNNIRLQFGRIDVADSCKCDVELQKLKGPGVKLYMEEQLAKSNNSSGVKASGKDGPVFFSSNFQFDFTDSESQDSLLRNIINIPPTGTAVTVAVFDTGLDSTVDKSNRLKNNLYKNDRISCIGNINANNGWNFVNNKKNWTDDNHPGYHGSVVARVIIDQSYTNNSSNIVRLLPVKVLDNNGGGNLYEMLCGLAYAKERGVQIINLSLGYYSKKYYTDSFGNKHLDSSGFLLKNFINDNLVPFHILLVVAAGNDDPSIKWDNSRNLNNVNFYPASLADSIENVIAVTTVNNTIVSPMQNYSPNIVDIGVRADRLSDFSFFNPLNHSSPKIGSSFATPIVTGKLAANYSLISGVVNNTSFTKDKIWSIFEQRGLLSIDTDLTDQIKSGVMKR